jgi:hypothetical protein
MSARFSLRNAGRHRKFAYTLISSAVLGSALAVGAAVMAQDGEEKREPVRDDPRPVETNELPSGEHLYELSAPRMHGRILIFPPGQDPPKAEGENPTAGWGFTPFYDLDSARKAGLIVSPDAMPPGYAATSGSALLAVKPDGSSEFTTAGAKVEGAGFPIDIYRSRTSQYFANQPYSLPAWLSGNVMTTLGEVGGKPAVFVHRRPGVTTSELQQVFIEDDGWVILVESYLDDFQKLVRVAESVLANSKVGQSNGR